MVDFKNIKDINKKNQQQEIINEYELYNGDLLDEIEISLASITIVSLMFSILLIWTPFSFLCVYLFCIFIGMLVGLIFFRKYINNIKEVKKVD